MYLVRIDLADSNFYNYFRFIYFIFGEYRFGLLWFGSIRVSGHLGSNQFQVCFDIGLRSDQFGFLVDSGLSFWVKIGLWNGLIKSVFRIRLNVG